MIILTFNSHSYSCSGVLSKSCHIIAAVLADAITIQGIQKKKILKREHATGDLTLYYFPKDSKGEKDWSIVRTVSLG